MRRQVCAPGVFRGWSCRGAPRILPGTRYNLIENKVCGVLPANLFGVVLPWILSLFFYAGSYLNDLMNWSSALLFVELNFLLPLLLYVRISKHRKLLDANPCVAPKSYACPVVKRSTEVRVCRRGVTSPRLYGDGARTRLALSHGVGECQVVGLRRSAALFLGCRRFVCPW